MRIILNEEQYKRLVLEFFGYGRPLFHFTTFRGLIGILTSGRILLQASFGNQEQKFLRIRTPYFLSLTRILNSEEGYGWFVTKERGESITARIEFNGDMLGSNFQIKPVAFFKNAKNEKFLNKSHVSVESEDRLYSSKPYINDIFSFINRIDVYIDVKFLDETDVIHLKDVVDGLDSNIYERIHFYDNISSYNFNREKDIRLTDIIDSFEDIDDIEPYSEPYMSSYEIEQSENMHKELAMSIIGLIQGVDGLTNAKMFNELKKYGLMKYKDACYPRKISYYGIDEFFSSIRSKFRYFNLKPDDDSRALIQMLVDFFQKQRI